MKATVVRMHRRLPTCEAKKSNDLLVLFPPPDGKALVLGDTLVIDLSDLGLPQRVTNITQGKSHKLILRRNDIHDLTLTKGHGTNRFSTPQRLVKISKT
jgi:hypothetical protein